MSTSLGNARTGRSQALLWAIGSMVVVGTGVGSYLLQPPPPEEHRATAVVAPPTIARDSAGILNLFANDIPELVMSDAIVAHVTEQVPQLDVDEYLQGIEASRRGATSLLEISFVHSVRQVAQNAVIAAATRIVDESARPEFDKARHLLDQAQDRVDQAESEIVDFSRVRGVFDPDVEYANVLQQIAEAERRITAATIEELDESAIEAMVAQRDSLVGQRERLGSILLTHETLVAELDRAREDLERARSQYAEAEYEYLLVNNPGELILSQELRPFVDFTSRLQQAAFASVVALILTLIILIPIGAWMGRRRSNGRHEKPVQEEPHVYDLSDATTDPRELIDERH